MIVPSIVAPDSAPSERRKRRHRFRWRRLLGVALLALLVPTAGGAVFLATLPGVGDAEQRVHHLLAAHGGIDTGLPPDARTGPAVIAVEDQRFYQHHGVDLLGIARAGVGSLSATSDQGGSTISQQLAKVLYRQGASGFKGKLDQVGLAVKLENAYSKAEILEMYLNAVYFGDGNWGLNSASRGYFGLSPTQLDWNEATLLAGLPQAPSAYNPRRHLDLARQRQRHVLDRLVSTERLSPAQAESIYHQPLKLTP